MSYRKVHVGDEVYEYTISERFVKIKGMALWSRWDYDLKDYSKEAVKPSHIKSYIERTLAFRNRRKTQNLDL